jgi:DNA-binding response OmpR family regulator
MDHCHNVLLVDGDCESRALVGRQLELAGEFAARYADSGGQAISALDAGRFDAILVEAALPDMDGSAFCRLVQQHGVSAPIMVLSRSPSEADAVLALDSGAIDYIVKPASPGVLRARLRAHLRQHERSDAAALGIGRFTFLPGMKRLVDRIGGRKLPLTAIETAMLRYLHAARPRGVGHAELQSEVLGYRDGIHSHTVQTHIYRLRRKLERDPRQPSILVTAADGYRLLTDPAAPT